MTTTKQILSPATLPPLAQPRVTHLQKTMLIYRLVDFDPAATAYGSIRVGTGNRKFGAYGNLDFVVMFLAAKHPCGTRRGHIKAAWSAWRGVQMRRHAKRNPKTGNNYAARDTPACNDKVDAVINNMLTRSRANKSLRWYGSHFVRLERGVWGLSAKGWKRAEELADAFGL